MNCNPPKSKIANYEFRFLKVTKDVAWHLMGVKRCTPPTVMPGNGGNGGNRYRQGCKMSRKQNCVSCEIANPFSKSNCDCEKLRIRNCEKLRKL